MTDDDIPKEPSSDCNPLVFFYFLVAIVATIFGGIALWF